MQVKTVFDNDDFQIDIIDSEFIRISSFNDFHFVEGVKISIEEFKKWINVNSMKTVYMIESNVDDGLTGFHWWIDGIFSEKEKAENFLLKNKFTKRNAYNDDEWWERDSYEQEHAIIRECALNPTNKTYENAVDTF